MNKLLEIISSADGKISTMRASVFIVVLSIMGVFIGHNVVAMVKSSLAIVPLGWDQVTVLTTLLAAKAYQSKLENSNTLPIQSVDGVK